MRQTESQGTREAKSFLHELALSTRWKSSIANLDYWERDYLGRVMPGLRRLARNSTIPFARTRNLRNVAAKLALLRGIAAERNPGRWRRDQQKFRGNPKHLDRLLPSLGAPSHINEWNAWRTRHPRVRPDLRGVNLWGLNLQGVRLHRARLDGATLGGASSRGSDLRGASFVKANLSGVDFSHTDMRGADMRQALLQDALLSAADLSGADMRGAFLTGCVLNRAELYGAKLNGALVWGTSVWDVRYDSTTKQNGLLIGWDDLDPIDVAMGLEDEGELRLPDQSLRVDSLRVAHFMTLVRENEHLAEVFDVASSRAVLLLGRFTGEQAGILDALRDFLLRHEPGYAPVVFDFREPRDRDLIETVATLAGLAKFIIADLTNPRSTPLESLLTIPQIAIPWAPIIRADDQPFSMFDALQRKYEWVLPTVRYRSAFGLLKQLDAKVIGPAERLSKKLRAMKHGPRLSASGI